MSQNPILIARQLIERHGLRAAAVAQEYASEARVAGQTAASDHWLAVQAAVSELKAGERKAAASRAAAE